MDGLAVCAEANHYYTMKALRKCCTVCTPVTFIYICLNNVSGFFAKVKMLEGFSESAVSVGQSTLQHLTPHQDHKQGLDPKHHRPELPSSPTSTILKALILRLKGCHLPWCKPHSDNSILFRGHQLITEMNYYALSQPRVSADLDFTLCSPAYPLHQSSAQLQYTDYRGLTFHNTIR